jgi:hypothetical protein
MKFVDKASNALTLNVARNCSVTFWHRAMAAVGRVEAHYTDEGKGTYASATLFGYMVSAQLPVALPARAIGARNFDWASYRAPCKLKLRKTTRSGRLVGRVFAWALRFPEVQAAIVAQFENNATPMCNALGRAVSDAVDGRDSIDADSVNGLDRMIESAVEQAFEEHDRHFEIDAEKVTGLADAIDDALNNDEVRKDLVGEVMSELVDRLRS